MAGWWIWGAWYWIGSGWCSGDGPWSVGDDGRIAQVEGARGVSRQKPAVALRGVARGDDLGEWISALSLRLSGTHVLCGGWSRCVTDAVLRPDPGGAVAGVFLDPPYAGEGYVYTGDEAELDRLSHEVREWALTSARPDVRIVVAGYEGEHGDAFGRAGWREVEWFRPSGLRRTEQSHRERLWLSPHCLSPSSQLGLFGEG